MVGNIISEILGRSPVQPIQKHIDIAFQCASLLPSLVEAANLNDWKKVAKINQEIRKLENKADEKKSQIRSHLPKSLFMPVPRQDLLELVMVQDKIANVSKKISGMIDQRSMQIPASMYDDFYDFVLLCVDAVKFAKQSVHELDELYETGFRGAEVKLVQQLIDTLDKTETKTDEMQNGLQYSLFQIEKQLPPIEVMFLYKFIDRVAEVADMSEQVGRRLELLLAK